MNKMSKPNTESILWRVDFHVHTIYSPDSLTTPEQLVKTCARKGLDKIAITDHNTIKGALEAKALAPERVIIGEEIMTTAGEILAFFIKEEIPPGMSPKDTIKALQQQDAFISISHPFDRFRKGSWKIQDLLEITPDIDAIETFNARCFLPRDNWKAMTFARQHHVSGTYGSDAHASLEIGNASLFLPPFHNRTTLKLSLEQAFSPPLVLSPPWVHLFSRYAVWKKRIAR